MKLRWGRRGGDDDVAVGTPLAENGVERPRSIGDQSHAMVADGGILPADEPLPRLGVVGGPEESGERADRRHFVGCREDRPAIEAEHGTLAAADDRLANEWRGGVGHRESIVGEAIAIGPGDHPACWIDVDRRIVGGEPNKFGGAGFGGRRGPRTLASGGAGGQLLGERGDDAHRRVAIGGLGEIAEGRRRGGEEGDKPGQDGVVELPCGSE